jgi:hypothetical protein
VCGQIVGAATPAGLTAAQAALEARWGAQIRAQGLAALLDPWWYLRADDGQPPVIAGLIESAMTNPNRPLASVLRSFAAVEPDKREALTDQVRAFLGRAFAGALGEARLRYVDVMRSRPEFNWPRDPWAAVLPYVQNDPPAQILVDHQGEDHDGGMFDDPDDDSAWEKLKFGVQEAAWAWGPTLLQYNPPALFYQGGRRSGRGRRGGGSQAARGSGPVRQVPDHGRRRHGRGGGASVCLQPQQGARPRAHGHRSCDRCRCGRGPLNASEEPWRRATERTATGKRQRRQWRQERPWCGQPQGGRAHVGGDRAGGERPRDRGAAAQIDPARRGRRRPGARGRRRLCGASLAPAAAHGPGHAAGRARGNARGVQAGLTGARRGSPELRGTYGSHSSTSCNARLGFKRGGSGSTARTVRNDGPLPSLSRRGDPNLIAQE